jgi:hypothetical protein
MTLVHFADSFAYPALVSGAIAGQWFKLFHYANASCQLPGDHYSFLALQRVGRSTTYQLLF